MRLVHAAVCFLLLTGSVNARTVRIYVSPNGNDLSLGDSFSQQGRSGPLRTISEAVSRARRLRHGTGESVQIFLAPGTFNLSQPLVLTEQDSGLLIQGDKKSESIISGGTRLRGWTCSVINPNIWQVKIPAVQKGDWNFHQLFVNGQRRDRTRIPSQGYYLATSAGLSNRPTALPIHPTNFDSLKLGPEAELVAYEAWAQSRNLISGGESSSNILSLAGRALPNQVEPHPRYFIENAAVPLRPGEWHLDANTGWLSYWPVAGEDMLCAIVVAPRLFDLVRIQGKSAQPAHDIFFRDVTFAEADWRLDGGSDEDIQAAIEVPGAVQTEFASDCAFIGCRFTRLGGYGLDLGCGCQWNRIEGNDFHDLGGGGVRVGETELNSARKFPCGENLITDNHVHDIGLINAPAVGILILLSSGNQIAHNEVDHTFYTAISLGWSWGYNPTACQDNVVEWNHLHDLGQGKLSDMGGVYTLGLQPGTIIRNNLIHDIQVFKYGGWGLYTDEGSTGLILESNIVYRCQNGGFHQHYGRDNIIRNNIFALNQEAQLMRTRLGSGTAFIFTNNIVYYNSGYLLAGRWGKDMRMDQNIYYGFGSALPSEQALPALRYMQRQGQDQHSLWADPIFISPSHDDFRLRRNSPAARFGFHPLDLTKAGIRPRSQWP